MAKKPVDAAKPIRCTVSIPADQHEELRRIADKKRASLSWVVRDAIDRYLAAESPLFRQER